VCVIGGGAAGIVTARHMRARGFDVTLFERSNDVGGLWRYGSETCKVFANVTQNLTKNHNRFAGLKPPNSWPNYLGHEHTVSYLSAYVDAFALRPCIKLNHEVRSVVRRDDGTFEVVVEDLSKRVSKREDAKKSRVIKTNAGSKPVQKNVHTKRFDAVAVCAGQLSVPNLPDDTAIPGLSGFTGEITHTSLYRTSEPFRGKRVLVVGVGAASGSDVAQDVCGVAAKTTLAARSHRWLIRRGLSGGRRSFLTRITDWLPTSLGLLAHLYFESVPTLRKLARTKGATDGGDLLAAAALGRVTIKPALVSVRGDEVTFQDGSFDRFDVVIFATGFRRDLPFDLSLSLKEESFESESSCDGRRESESESESARDDDFQIPSALLPTDFRVPTNKRTPKSFPRFTAACCARTRRAWRSCFTCFLSARTSRWPSSSLCGRRACGAASSARHPSKTCGVSANKSQSSRRTSLRASTTAPRTLGS
jgi:dimethylaniline monooxygenase (N-oxide forming)